MSDLNEAQHALDCMTTAAGELQDIVNAQATELKQLRELSQAVVDDQYIAQWQSVINLKAALDTP